MRKSHFFITALLILIFNNLRSQDTTVIGNFTAAERQGTVYLNWSILAGFTCIGTSILRSTDQVNYTEIGELDGICGSLTEAVSYSYKDETPEVNQVNYYRLSLGGVSYSEVVSAKVIELKDQGYQIRPHPIRSTGRIYFDNPKKDRHQLLIYNTKATPVLLLETKQDFFELDARQLPSTAYIFSIVNYSTNNIIVKGKLIVQ